MPAHSDWNDIGHRFRAFVDGGHGLLDRSNGDAALRTALTSAQPIPALAFLMTWPASNRASFLPEILAVVARGPSQALLLARDVLRCTPRTDLESRLPSLLSETLTTGDDQVFSRMAEVVIELRLEIALATLQQAAARHADHEVQELFRELVDVEHDDLRWGRLVSEWPVRQGEQPGPTARRLDS